MKPNPARPYWITTLLLALGLVLSVAVGSVFLSPAMLWDALRSRLGGLDLGPEVRTAAAILLDLRLPRTLLVALTGAALSGSGAAYQGLFRNPLADPYLIGVASGAGLGAVAAMSLRWPYTTIGLLAIPMAAFGGAVLSVLIVYQLARVGKAIPASNLILAGVAISSLATALTSFLMLSGEGEVRRALVWMLGGASMSGWGPVLGVLPYVGIGLTVLILTGHALNVLQVGDEQARQLGLPVERARRIILAAASLTTAAAVAFSGIIGFVGLIVPHIIRLIWGGDYRRLLPLAMIGGAALLLFADIVARVLLAPQEVPLGIITALLGAPFFLWVLRRSRQQNLW